MRSKSNRNKSRVQQLIYTLFQGLKKGLLPVRPEKVLSNLFDHAKALGTEREPMTPEQLECIDRTVSDLFGRSKRIGERINTRFPISSKSTIESSYSNFGALGELLRQISPMYLVDEEGNVTTVAIGSLSRQFFGFGRFRDWEVFEISGPWAENIDIYKRAAEEAYKSLFETPMSEPSCILEPMKVRIITKPKWNQYLCMKDIQKSWWRHLRDHKSGFFDLIGRPVNEADISAVINPTPFSWSVVSGDYSAATDNLKMEVTLRILKGMTLNLDDFMVYPMCRNALTGGKITYNFRKVIPNSEWMEFSKDIWGRFQPLFVEANLNTVLDSKGQPTLVIDQKNGQLMGSIISFILLCVANLSAYRYAIETFENKKISLNEMKKRRPVRINGDDILFSCERDFYTHWCKTIGEFGFNPSPGKNLYHRDYCQINSVFYKLDRYLCRPSKVSTSVISRQFDAETALQELETSHIIGQAVVAHEVPYVNFGLMCNRKKQDCEIDTTVHYISKDDLNDSLYGRMKSIDKVQNALLDGLHPRLAEKANRIFYRHQQPWLERCFPGLNPFISKGQGGLGLQDTGIEFLESRDQRRVRIKLRDMAFSRPLRDFDLKSYLLGVKSGDRIVNLIRQEAGSFFPALRLRSLDEETTNPFGTNSLDPEWSPVNRWFRLMKAKISKDPVGSNDDSEFASRWAKICQIREDARVKELYSTPYLGLTHQRVMRFDSPERYHTANGLLQSELFKSDKEEVHEHIV